MFCVLNVMLTVIKSQSFNGMTQSHTQQFEVLYFSLPLIGEMRTQKNLSDGSDPNANEK